MREVERLTVAPCGNGEERYELFCCGNRVGVVYEYSNRWIWEIRDGPLATRAYKRKDLALRAARRAWRKEIG